jgi:hypothetical protein
MGNPGAGAQWSMDVVSRELAQTDFSDEAGPGDGQDHYSHAEGRICVKCDRRIEAGQNARRKGVDGWVHDICPLALD